MNAIHTSITSEAITGLSRIGEHENFVITRDLNMIQQVRVITLDSSTGLPITEQILADESLTPDQKKAALQRYADQIVTRETDGAYVNVIGQVVPADYDGQTISQRDFFQSITLGALKQMGITINDSTTVASLIYLLIQREISNIDSRGGF
ncbi:hypothetical protein GO730_05835 [Spirosoma sp. HMF3257]|uniref:Uncharacterized protein n=1 Tax=Spirosoma telluris TaxID=2183553 RepID=A0A327NJ06_9BACT|nr:hypothetical protein [Spirosoma telluris]RAI73996.1 hypothetical protein HMF3257_05790 [Spirosoma telluris]